jgi:uncharacterized membrane protein
MVERKPTAERLSLFSGGIFAIIITILVLELGKLWTAPQMRIRPAAFNG